MLEPLYTADEMQAAEGRYPGSDEELMERAGCAVADEAMRRWPDAKRFVALCGSGKNGGDGRIAVELLRAAGRDAEAAGEPQGADVVLDALFGTGFHGEPRPEAARLIEAINDSGAGVVSVDIPSGVNASSGEVPGVAVRADLTVTFHGRKVGHEVAPGRFHAGDVVVADIGLEPGETKSSRATQAILGLVPRRSAEDNKYTAGHVVVVGGSPGMTGAPCLSALAALRADTGYVTLAGPSSAIPVFEHWVLEAVKRPLPEDDHGFATADGVGELLDLLGKGGALAIGPGLGRSEGTKELVRRLLAEARVPAVVDGDALFELEPANWPAPRVLTPHSGELARLLGIESDWVDAHRLEALERAVDRFGCVVLLKGAGTLVAEPGAGAIVCGGDPSLATAGTGDVLTGILAAFLAKGVEPRLAAAAAAVAHTEAASEAPQKNGLIASDLIEALPRALGDHAPI
ncbi:MAG: NAD(P)H-hydrate dehydratase [Actinobacteria bacterium]|nr:NAD(P)H-hydrate dehydratase [Actinomycetota bacterium]